MMKFIVIVLYLLLGLFYFMTSRNCCSPSDTAQPIVNKIDKDYPIYFYDGKAKAHQGAGYAQLKDSLVSNLHENEILAITGYYHPTETNSTSFENLGYARADAIRESLGLSTDQVKLISRERKTGWHATDKFEASSYASRIFTKKIQETATGTRIYFPYNSTDYLEDTEINNYLKSTISKLSPNQSIELIGHTDNEGTDDYNYTLGINRASQVRNMLTSLDLSNSRISIDSKGESEPIISNDTDIGRAKNRRVELKIINN